MAALEDTTIPLFARDNDSPSESRSQNITRAATHRDRDPGWALGARAAIEAEARSGRQFTAVDIAERYQTGEPPHPNFCGPAFSAARAAGVIVPVGATPSRRRTVNGSLVRIWRGAPAWIATDSAVA